MRPLRRHLWILIALIAPARALAEPRDDARRHFRLGLEAAQAGQYEVALAEFQAAQQAWPHPVTVYNIARSYQDLGDVANAISWYELYREAAPDKAGDVDPILAVLRAQQQTAAAPESGPTGTATGDELARLRALADEVTSLVEAISARSAAEAPPPDPAPDLGEVPVEAPPPPEFQSDAYERVVVSASRFGQAQLDSPSTITTLSAEDIRRSGVMTVPELLRRVVGVDTMSMAAGQTDVSIRGFNRELSNKVLVLIDGRSTYLDFIGTSLWATLPISLDDIDRIEVIRGPGSAVYGANAVTGVVNIITRTPGDGDATVTATAGTVGTAAASAVATGGDDVTAWRLSVGWQHQGRYAKELDVDGHAALSPLFDDDDTGLSVIRASGRVDRKFFDQGVASATVGYSETRAEFYNLGALGDFGLEDRHLTLRGDVGYGPVVLRAFWNHDEGRVGPWVEPVGASQSLVSPFSADTIDVELSARGQGTTGPVEHAVFGGVSWRRKHLTDFTYLGPDGPTVDENHFAAFLNEQATVGKVSVVASLRADAHPLIPLSRTISPRGAAIWRLGDTRSLRVSGGSAFRVPTLVESYMDFRIPTGVNGVFLRDFGDQGLRPERVLTGEIGLHDESSDIHTADVAVFVNRLDGLIGLAPVTPVALPYDPVGGGWAAGSTGWVNTAPVYLGYGVEAEGELFPTDGVDLYGSVALTHYSEREGDVSVADRATSLVKATGGATWRSPWRVDASIDAQAVSSQVWRLREFDATGALVVVESRVPARVVFGGRLAARPFADEHLEVSVSAFNVAAALGTEVREHPKGQPMPTRVTGSLRWTF
jgi:outer membrane cobalamin receptor